MASAAFLPAPMARMTVAAPVTASPPAKTFSRVDISFSSTMMPPFLFVSRPGVVERISGFGDVPRDMMTISTSSTNSLPSMGIGRRRPDASGSPSSILMHFMPHTRPSSPPRISVGLVSVRNSMPSSFAWCCSSSLAGISASPRR